MPLTHKTEILRPERTKPNQLAIKSSAIYVYIDGFDYDIKIPLSLALFFPFALCYLLLIL